MQSQGQSISKPYLAVCIKDILWPGLASGVLCWFNIINQLIYNDISTYYIIKGKNDMIILMEKKNLIKFIICNVNIFSTLGIERNILSLTTNI